MGIHLRHKGVLCMHGYMGIKLLSDVRQRFVSEQVLQLTCVPGEPTRPGGP